MEAMPEQCQELADGRGNQVAPGAIIRHQKAISGSLEILGHLKQEERIKNHKAALEKLKSWTPDHHVELEAIRARFSDDVKACNRGFSDSLGGAAAVEDSWEALYYAFLDLKGRIDTLEKRADKIAESMLVMINVQNQNTNLQHLVVMTEIVKLIEISSKKREGTLSAILGSVSVVMGSFTIMDTIYSSDFDKPLWLAPRDFWLGLLGVLGVLRIVGLLIGWYLRREKPTRGMV